MAVASVCIYVGASGSVAFNDDGMHSGGKQTQSHKTIHNIFRVRNRVDYCVRSRPIPFIFIVLRGENGAFVSFFIGLEVPFLWCIYMICVILNVHHSTGFNQRLREMGL